MAYNHVTLPGFTLPQQAANVVKSFFAAVGRALVLAAETNPRLMEAERLSAKSDAELSKMGLKREDIIRFVFRDILDV